MKNLSRFLGTMQGKVIGGIIIIIIALFAYYFYATKGVDTTTPAEIVVSDTDHIRGALDGKITLVEFGDFQCPACGAYEPLVRKLVVDNAGILKVVFRHFPLTPIHQNALLAAKASESAGLQGKFWEMHDILYDKQSEWSGALNARDIFINYASILKLDQAKFISGLENKSIEEKILAEFKEGVKLGVQGTPTFFVNGKKIDSPKSIEDFDKIIKDAAK